MTVDDICLAADVSKGGFYHHFPDKESAFLVVASGELTREMELLAHSASNTPVERGGRCTAGGPVGLDTATPAGSALGESCTPSSPQATVKRCPAKRHAGTASTGDQEAQAALALLVGIGRVVQRATARYATTGELERRKAAAS